MVKSVYALGSMHNTSTCLRMEHALWQLHGLNLDSLVLDAYKIQISNQPP